jgi:hypothetical protein
MKKVFAIAALAMFFAAGTTTASTVKVDGNKTEKKEGKKKSCCKEGEKASCAKGKEGEKACCKKK